MHCRQPADARPPQVFVAMLLASALCVGMAGSQRTAVASGFTLMNESREIEQGRKLDAEIGKKLGFYTDAKLQSYVSEVGRRLVRAGSPRSFEYELKIVDMAEENAFASMGGFVYITRGMLAELNSEAELAGVLAHEIGHISARHVPKQLTRQLLGMGAMLGAMALGATVRSPSSNLDKAPLALSALLAQVMYSYSQEAELEADEQGLFLAAQAGYDPRVLVGFLRSFRMKERLTGTGYHGMLATHPESTERVAKAEVLAQILASQTPARTIGGDTYKAHLDGLPYGKREDRLRLALYTVQPDDTVPGISQKLLGEGGKVWDVARLNRLRSDDPLQAGMLLKIVVPDDRPLRLPQRRLDMYQERPDASSQPPPRPTRGSRIPYPTD
ncbi:MAG: M48 family metalloprotease [Nitrospinae bacterium]|nr:M48 family metalloprotease [Nitrospinota bacterium]